MGALVDFNGWTLAASSVFWKDIAPCDHVVQIYEDDEDFLRLLENYIVEGIHAQEAVVIIATELHLNLLKTRIENHGIDYKSLVASHQYQPLDAADTLASFMVNDMPDEALFFKAISRVMQRAQQSHTKVRAFGEMVALLWAKGNKAATLQLEQLWNQYCAHQQLCLFCAYPKSGLLQSGSDAVLHICSAHSKMVTTDKKSQLRLFYKQM